MNNTASNDDLNVRSCYSKQAWSNRRFTSRSFTECFVVYQFPLVHDGWMTWFSVRNSDKMNRGHSFFCFCFLIQWPLDVTNHQQFIYGSSEIQFIGKPFCVLVCSSPHPGCCLCSPEGIYLWPLFFFCCWWWCSWWGTFPSVLPKHRLMGHNLIYSRYIVL